MKTNYFKKTAKLLSIAATLLLALTLAIATNVNAATEGFAFSVSPMKEKIVLNPGDEYSSSIKVYSTQEYTSDVKYKIKAAGFYKDEDNKNIFEECTGRCDMADWITINSPTEGRLSPGEELRVEYTINVPEDAAGGGQYASIIVEGEAWTDETESDTSSNHEEDIKSSVTEKKRIAYTIYAEITGDVIRQGEIIDVNVPSFLFSGEITGISSVKNTGNVHGDATYKLQVFPLFSDEEIYTNEETPDDKTVLPDRTIYNETSWPGTPSMGIFNVLYTVEFEGVTAQVSKMVIVCPIWLLFLILFVIAALIIWAVLRIKARKSPRKSSAHEDE